MNKMQLGSEIQCCEDNFLKIKRVKHLWLCKLANHDENLTNKDKTYY